MILKINEFSQLCSIFSALTRAISINKIGVLDRIISLTLEFVLPIFEVKHYIVKLITKPSHFTFLAAVTLLVKRHIIEILTREHSSVSSGTCVGHG